MTWMRGRCFAASHGGSDRATYVFRRVARRSDMNGAGFNSGPGPRSIRTSAGGPQARGDKIRSIAADPEMQPRTFPNGKASTLAYAIIAGRPRCPAGAAA